MRENNMNGGCNTSIKKINRCRSFHFRYLELCRAKNYPPISEIKSKNNATSILDFFGDKLKADDWLFVIEALHYDQILQHLSIRLRKSVGNVVEHIDNEKKAKVFKQKPAVVTKYIFTGVVEAIANCLQFNKNLVVLNLEALPLCEKYVVTIAKALSTNEHLRQLSFQRSPIGDKGCEAICSTIKYVGSIDTINLSECNLTAQAAVYVSDMIKFQKICRYTDGWQKSLRYRDVDPDTMPGLRVISLAKNPNISDEGVIILVEILKEDAWIKIIDMENCGITDSGANRILDCLEINNTIIDFNIRNNIEVSKFLQKNIRQQLGKDEENSTESSENSLKKSRVSISQLMERLKFLEEQIASEKVLRKQVEMLNDKLHRQILLYENQLAENANSDIPEGYVLVKNDALESIINERNDLYKAASALKLNKTKGYLKKISKVRKVKSEVKYKQQGIVNKISKSDYEFGGFVNKTAHPKDIIFEKNIGDNAINNYQQMTGRIEKNKKNTFKYKGNYSTSSPQSITSDSEEVQDTSDPIKVFIRKKPNGDIITAGNEATAENCPSPRSLFLGLNSDTVTQSPSSSKL